MKDRVMCSGYSDCTPPPPEERVPSNPYEVNKKQILKRGAMTRREARTKNKTQVKQKTLTGGEISVQSAEDFHRAHIRFMENAARDKSL